MNIEQLLLLRSCSHQSQYGKFKQWSFKYQIENLSLARKQLRIRNKSFVSCIEVDSTENQFLISGDSMGKIRLFDLGVLDNLSESRTEIISSNTETHPECHQKRITALAWYPIDSGLFVSSSTDCYVNIWDTNSFEIVSHFKFKSSVLDVQMPRQGSFTHKLVAACSPVTGVSLIDLYSGNRTQTITGNPGKVSCCCWNPLNEFELLVGDSYGFCYLYDIRRSEINHFVAVVGGEKDGEPIPVIETPLTSCHYSPDGSTIVCVSNGETPLKVFDGFSHEPMEMEFENVSAWDQVVQKPCIAEESGESYLMYPDALDCSVRIFDLSNGKEVNRMIGHVDSAICCCFRKQTCEVFSGGRDGFVLKYDNMRWNHSRRYFSLKDEPTDRWECPLCSIKQTIQNTKTILLITHYSLLLPAIHP